MEFLSNDKPIYLQMADRLCDDILAGIYEDDARIPSVRDYATQLQVNTNTAVKAYDELSRNDVIYQRRGMGYFVTPGARKTIMEERRREFLSVTLRRVFREMELLDVSIDDIVKEYKNKR